jgi:ABC-2 type transport system permease protein
VSPAYRGALVTGKALSAGLRGLAQGVIIYVLALAMGIHLRFAPLALVSVVAVVMLGSAVFATFSLIVACVVKTRERFMGIGQVLTMPLFFASNAIYPLAIMPPWLRAVARVNPLSYMVDALRGAMIQGGQYVFGAAADIAVLVGVFAVLLTIAARLYPGLVR